MNTHAPLAALRQPHPIHISMTFLRACAPGEARITLTPVKTGRGFSFVRARLAQGKHARLEAMIVFADLNAPQRGPTLEIAEATVIPPRVGGCVLLQPPPAGITDPRPALRKLQYWVPRGKRNGSAEDARNVREQWVALESGERMGVPALGYLADTV